MTLAPEHSSLLSAMLDLPWGATVAQIGAVVGRSITVADLRPLISAGLVLEVERKTPPERGFAVSPRGKEAAGQAIEPAHAQVGAGGSPPLGSTGDGLVTVPEAARILGITPDNVYRAIKKGRIPAVYLEGRKYDMIRVPRSAIKRWCWAPGSPHVLPALLDPVSSPAITAGARLVYLSLFVSFSDKLHGSLDSARLARATALNDAVVASALDELERKGLIVRKGRPKGPAYAELRPPWAPARPDARGRPD